MTTATMATAPPCPSGNGAKAPSAPKKGYDVQYERLLAEEKSLKRAREEFLNSSSSGDSSSSAAASTELRDLKTRSMVHRASLGGMLLAARRAAEDEARSRPDAASESPEDVASDALAALWTRRSRELEEGDNEAPPYVASESLAWRKRIASEMTAGDDSVDGSEGSVVVEASVDDFFAAFPSCRRQEHFSYSNNVDESDDDEIFADRKQLKEQKKQKSKKGDEPLVVSCSSSSPSPERQPGKSRPETISQGNAINTQPQQSTHNNPGISNFGPSRNRAIQSYPSRYPKEGNYANPYQQSMRQQSQQHLRPQQGPQRYQNDYQQDHHNQESSFDYHASEDQSNTAGKQNAFRTAKELGPKFNDAPRGGNKGGRWDDGDDDWDNYGNSGRTGGTNNRPAASSAPNGPQQMVRAAMRGPKDNLSAGLKRKFQPPMKQNNGQASGNVRNGNQNSNSTNHNRQAGGAGGGGNPGDGEDLPEELRGLDKELVEKISNEIVDSGEPVTFEDIAGLDHAKGSVNEMVILPMKRPDLFTGLRSCPKGLLLFGPPGTGKTLIGKAIAHESRATFFSISSSSLTSKWIGEGEKLVRTLFAVASYRAPSVVFIDEVDSMLTQRKADENEASRRMKTEFLVQLDGAGNGREGQVLVVGATNLPHELDDAARRRFVRKLYIPLPDERGRQTLISTLLSKNKNTLSEKEIVKLSKDTHGFSGADISNLCKDASLGPIRQLGAEVETMDTKAIPPISYKHFRRSLRGMNPSVAESDLAKYIEWNNTYGNKISNGENSQSDTDSGDESS